MAVEVAVVDGDEDADEVTEVVAVVVWVEVMVVVGVVVADEVTVLVAVVV